MARLQSVRSIYQAKLILLFLNALLVLELPSSLATVCPPGYSSTGEMCYTYHSENKEWRDARATCRRNHEDLISLDTWSKFVSLRDIAIGYGSSAWVGAHDVARGSWKWTNGKTLSSSSPVWASGEPNDYGEDCVEFYESKDFKLNDEECYQQRPFFCEAKACRNIQHCKNIQCTVTTPSICKECDGHKHFYKPTTSDTKCEQMCAWNNHYCWPGSCADELLKNCQCSNDFYKQTRSGETSCQPRQDPSIETCSQVAIGSHGEKKMSETNGPTNECRYQVNYYGNYKPVKFQYKHVSSFQVNVSSFPTKPKFINETNFGITNADIEIYFLRVTGAESSYSTTQLLVDSKTIMNVKSLLSREGNIKMSEYELHNGDSICLKHNAYGGGFLVAIDTSKANLQPLPATPYVKTKASNTVCYLYDNVAPQHCLEVNNCITEPLRLETRISRTPNILVEFQGWFDPPPVKGKPEYASSIESYEIRVNEVSGNVKLQVGTSSVFTKKVKITTNSMVLNITSSTPKLFCVTLEVKDVANNVRQARRFFLYDNSTAITSRKEDKSFYISSASVDTNYTWQTHHNDICLNWTDHFYNEFYLRNKLLEKIEPDSHGLINGIYEQNSGILPVNGTQNVHGIIQFKFSYSKNHSNFSHATTVLPLDAQTFCKSFILSDGDTFRLKIDATDIVKNSFSETKTVHIDRSVPQINNIWLEKDGYKRLFVHDQTDLSKMDLQFDAYDPHSGIKQVDWFISTTEDKDRTIESRSLGVKKMDKKTCSVFDKCYCPVIGKDCENFRYSVPLNVLKTNNKDTGDHNRNYYFTIKVTNNANLFNIEHMDILVDDSPPETGVVLEGPEDGPDIDYTSDDEFLIHWHGFIDHESGIKLYRVGLSDTCLTTQDFQNFNQHNKTSEDLLIQDVDASEFTLRLPANFTGKKYTSVIAFNNAMESSVPACSDGITKDKSPPNFHNVTLANAKWEETIYCQENKTWFLRSDLVKVDISEGQACKQTCYKTQNISFIESIRSKKAKAITLLPNITSEIESFGSLDGQRDEYEFICSTFPVYDLGKYIYLPDDQILLQWDAADEFSQISDFFIGFGRSASEKKAPSLINYISTGKKSLFKLHHAGIGTDEEFFIFLKGVNKAGLEMILPIGPVLIDQTPPRYRNTPDVVIDANEIIVGWENDTFYDDEQSNPINHILFQIGHENTMVTPMLEWRLKSSMRCAQYSGGCVKYPLVKLQKHDTNQGLNFHVLLHIYNNAGHFITVKTAEFTLPSVYPPGHAVVLDVDPTGKAHETSLNVMTQDVDAHFTENTVCASWNGFSHKEEVTVEFGLGSSDKLDDKIAFKEVNNTGFYCLTSPLIPKQEKVFVRLRATCSGGSTISNSNGVIIYEKAGVLDSLQVFDGPECFIASHMVEQLHFSHVFSPSDIIRFNYSFTVGNLYSMRFVSNNRTSLGLKVQSPSIIILSIKTDDFRSDITFQPITSVLEIAMVSFYNRSVYIKAVELYDCPEDISVQQDIHKIAAHWSGLADGFTYQYALISTHCPGTDNQSCIEHITPFETTSKSYVVLSGLQLILHTNYYMAVKPCLNGVCQRQTVSSGVYIDQDITSLKLMKSELIVDKDNCASIDILWQSSGERINISFYQWSISVRTSRSDVTYRVASWQTILNVTGNFHQVHECLHISKKHGLKTLYVCVRAFTSAGVMQQSCQVLKPILGQHTTNTVYDFDTSSVPWSSIKELLHSYYLGDKLTSLHDNEVDFGTRSTKIAGAIPHGFGRNITWYLMKERSIPTSCKDMFNCISSISTTSGYAKFPSHEVALYTVNYICAVADEAEIDRESSKEILPRISSCSDGFLIDDIPPSSGEVTVNSINGYINNVADFRVSWSNFEDNIVDGTLGYRGSIHYYAVLLGSMPGGRNIKQYGNLGGDTSLNVKDLTIEDGASVFVSVTATDYAGLNTTVTSAELVVDTSPPKFGKVIKEGFSHTTWVSSNILRARLVGFEDSESGIDYFVAYIGSSKNTDDVMRTKTVKSDRLELVLDEETSLDGHVFFLGVKAVNRAGVSSEYVYLKFAVDRSPPTGGHIMDGLFTDQKDIDYQTSVDYISGHWIGFVDPHSGISHYRVGLGTHPYSDDMEPMTSTGLRTYIIWNSTFTPGEKYFMTVEACNGAFLCRSLSSDGIILDNSPPVQGLVRVGSFSSHQTYIHKNSSVEIFWTGFTDPQSGLDHFEACIGTVPGKCDVTSNFNCLLASSHIKTGLDLPKNTDLYVTITAYNKVNMNMSEASNHFRVDSSPPIIQTKPKFFRNYTSFENVSAQWEKSLLRIYWKFIDHESPIVRHVVTLVTHHEGHTPVEHVEIGLENKLTISLDDKHWLHNGDTYKVLVTACNAAGLCTTAESETLLIDSTPAHLGGFKPPMSWLNFIDTSGTALAEMNLTWYGFHDQESGIKHFYIGVGKSYSGNELSNGLVRIVPNTRLNIHNTSLILNEPLLSNAKIVVAIMAENNAGLMSSISRVTLTTLQTIPGKLLQAAGGLLEIEKHSCDIHFCNKDCTCAVVGQPCAFLNTNSTCHSVNSTADNPFNLTVNVYGGMRGEIVKITASSSCLAAHWIVASGNASIKRFEWSLGIKDYNPGEGIFDSDELPWQDIGTRTEIVNCLSQNRSLIHETEYIAYVRVWVEADKYLVFKSLPIMVDHTAPAIRKGAYVKDSDSSCAFEYDVIDWADYISACWHGVFHEPQGRIVYYKIALGTSPGADDVLAQVNIGLNTIFNARKLHLSSGRRYFFTVTAYNNVGLYIAVSSDGFLVDMEKPNSGVVYNTKTHRNYAFHSSMSSFDLSWHGFLDHDSGIKSYFAALVEESENNTFVTNFTDVGLHTHVEITNVSLVKGRKYFGAVKAIDAANHESALVYSNSKLIDTTAPAAYICRDKSVLHEVKKPIRPLFATLERNAVYIVSGIVSISDYYPFVRIKIDGEHGHSVPLEIVQDGTFRFHYSSSANLYGNHSFTVESDTSAAVIEEVAVSKCVMFPTYDPSYALHVTQISSHMIKASVRVQDPESSIKRVLLAAGTKRGGVQHRSFYQIDKSSDEHIPLLVPHGTPVYITAVVENYAGLRSTFHSKRIIVDHTPPVIEDVNVVMTELSSDVNESNVTQSKERYVQLKATWNATDIESGIKLCFVSVGSHMYLDDIQKQELARHENLFVSSVITVSHGNTLFVNIKCVNNVELASAHEPQPVTVSVDPPTAVAAKVYFVPSIAYEGFFKSSDSDALHRPTAIQTNKSRVQFFWNGFEDDSGIDHYEYRLSSADNSTAWTDAGIKRHVTLDHLKLVDGQMYTAEVRAVNIGRLRSDVVNATIIVDSREPKLTGQPLNMSISGRNIDLNWAPVFSNDHDMTTVFDVTIGSTKGSADIIDKRNLETSQMSVSVPKSNVGSENIQELFISVSCWHSTGLKTTYKTNFKLPF